MSEVQNLAGLSCFCREFSGCQFFPYEFRISPWSMSKINMPFTDQPANSCSAVTFLMPWVDFSETLRGITHLICCRDSLVNRTVREGIHHDP